MVSTKRGNGEHCDAGFQCMCVCVCVSVCAGCQRPHQRGWFESRAVRTDGSALSSLLPSPCFRVLGRAICNIKMACHPSGPTDLGKGGGLCHRQGTGHGNSTSACHLPSAGMAGLALGNLRTATGPRAVLCAAWCTLAPGVAAPLSLPLCPCALRPWIAHVLLRVSLASCTNHTPMQQIPTHSEATRCRRHVL